MGREGVGKTEEGEKAAQHAAVEAVEPAHAGRAVQREPRECQHAGEGTDAEDGAEPRDAGPAVGRGGEIDGED